MTVVRTTTIHTYLGLNADTKPTTNVPAGSRFWETDTGDWYQYDGSAWTVESAAVSISGGFAGDVAHDAVDSGNPVKIGGKATSNISGESAVGADDRIDAAFTTKGAQIIAGGALLGDAQAGTYTSFPNEATSEAPLASGVMALAPDGLSDRLRTEGDDVAGGLGVLAVGLRTPGASEVKTLTVTIGATSVNRADAIATVVGKSLRVLAYEVVAEGLTTDPGRVGLYFGTGAAYTTNAASAIDEGSPGPTGSFGKVFGESGPLGADGEAISWITEIETETAMRVTIHYREEQ